MQNKLRNSSVCFSRYVDEKMDVDSYATEEKTSEAKTEVETDSSEEKPSTTDTKVCSKICSFIFWKIC